MKRPILLLCALGVAPVLIACSSGGGGAKASRLTLTGASTIAPLASEIAKRFESLHPAVRVDVQSGGSSRGVSDARAGLADIGMVSRALKDDEGDLRPFTIARDGVCVILHKSNPIATLSDAQVVAVYTGKITRWSEVGGKDAPITVVNKAEGRSTLELFLHHFKLKNTDVKAQVVIGDNEQGVKTVAGNPDSIGYVSIGTAEYDAGHGVAIKLMPVGGVAASIENVQSRKFPLARPLNLVVLGKAAPEGLAREFLDFATSPAVHDIVRAQYFVPLEK